MTQQALCLMIWLPAFALSGIAQTDWTRLAQLPTGQALQVLTRDGTRVEGRFQRFSADELSLRVDRGFFRSGDRTFTRPDVVRVSGRGGARRLLIGLGIGVAAGAAIAAAYSPRIDRSYGGAITKAGLFALTITTCGASGALIGFSARGYPRTIYQAGEIR